ncbi:hypothetical protein AWC12_00255 [Mycolicibacterium iranicum]|uniref:Uncharacterized protein n=1 Tax=Mycolicibacterium iranicum TaxID=912594 RepID=A0A1X1WJN8_MYCIR|nr:hypothetical protein AWC12_00255 [Mycolicibacterium iranicum]
MSRRGSYNGALQQFVDELRAQGLSLYFPDTGTLPSIPRKSPPIALGNDPRRILRPDELPSSGALLSHRGELSAESSVSMT